jgi:ectoine hydroxylase-related dioxygenase (phytanoyl-CoA dioxygenase family)
MPNLYTNSNGSYFYPSTDLEHLNQKLETDGVAVIPNILDQTQINSAIDGMHQWLNDVWSSDSERIKMDNINTYRNFYKLIPLHSGMIQHHGIGHQQFIWDIRQNQNVINTFSTIWSDPDLLVSFDGANFVFPPEQTNRGFYRGGQWFHTDQSSEKKGLHCIQGMVNLFDVTEGDGTLSVLVGSNNLHEQFFAEKGITERSDWYKISDDDLQWFINKGCQWRNVLAPAGSMILWDSRTFHMAIEPQKGRSSENFRFVTYVCMLPKSGATDIDIKKRILAFKSRRMTSHWPYKVKMFPKQPRTYGAALPKLNIDIVEKNKLKLNQKGLKLIGLDLFDDKTDNQNNTSNILNTSNLSDKKLNTSNTSNTSNTPDLSDKKSKKRNRTSLGSKKTTNNSYMDV